jgi:hypothetical protein
MSEVIIAPANMLGQRQRQDRAVLNDIGNLPLGTNTATVTTKFNDDDVSTEITTVNIPDSVARNKDYIESKLFEQQRSLIGKKSNVMPPNIFDLTAINNYNVINAQRTTKNEYVDEIYRRHDGIAMPFTEVGPIFTDEELASIKLEIETQSELN